MRATAAVQWSAAIRTWQAWARLFSHPPPPSTLPSLATTPRGARLRVPIKAEQPCPFRPPVPGCCSTRWGARAPVPVPVPVQSQSGEEVAIAKHMSPSIAALPLLIPLFASPASSLVEAARHQAEKPSVSHLSLDSLSLSSLSRHACVPHHSLSSAVPEPSVPVEKLKVSADAISLLHGDAIGPPAQRLPPPVQ